MFIRDRPGRWRQPGNRPKTMRTGRLLVRGFRMAMGGIDHGPRRLDSGVAGGTNRRAARRQAVVDGATLRAAIEVGEIAFRAKKAKPSARESLMLAG